MNIFSVIYNTVSPNHFIRTFEIPGLKNLFCQRPGSFYEDKGSKAEPCLVNVVVHFIVSFEKNLYQDGLQAFPEFRLPASPLIC